MLNTEQTLTSMRTLTSKTRANINAELYSLIQSDQVNNVIIFRFIQSEISITAKKLFIQLSKVLHSTTKINCDIEFLSKCKKYESCMQLKEKLSSITNA